MFGNSIIEIAKQLFTTEGNCWVGGIIDMKVYIPVR